jgi:crotonobetainyl-CoA:carnitine CoA-transferase CaiB-like acyl-CoA transferase
VQPATTTVQTDRMRLGDVVNEQDPDQPRPLHGIRVLAAEQMAALPYATQLLARLGAEVVKVEHPTMGDSGRGSVPYIEDPQGRRVGATFLRNNFSKRSVAIDLKAPEGVELFLDLAPRFDIVCENFKAGTADRLGIGHDAVAARHPEVVYLSVSGFGNDPASPYMHRAAYAAIVEGMSGIYEYKRRPGRRPMANPVGALGDISSALFGVIGILAALRHRDLTGRGQYIDIAMLDATMAMTDIVSNFYSMGIPDEASSGVGIVETFEAGVGNFVLQIVRENQFAKVAELTGNAAWTTDERFATRAGWQEHFEEVIRPGIERWAADKTNRMDFEFSPEQLDFAKEVEAFLDANDDPDVFDVTRENMAQIVDTPKRRAFMASLGRRAGWGITWPAEHGGSEARASTSTCSTRSWPTGAAPRSARASASSARRSSATAATS